MLVINERAHNSAKSDISNVALYRDISQIFIAPIVYNTFP